MNDDEILGQIDSPSMTAAARAFASVRKGELNFRRNVMNAEGCEQREVVIDRVQKRTFDGTNSL